MSVSGNTYTELFSIALRHHYRSENRNLDFELLPTGQTAELMAQRRLLWLPTATGISIYGLVASGSGSESRIYISADEKLGLTFLIVPIQPHFRIYSALPFAPEGDKIYRFHNLNNNPDGVNRLLTAPDSTKAVTSKDLVPIDSPIQRQALAPDPNVLEVTATDALNTIHYKREVEAHAEEQLDLVVNLETLPEGYYKLKIGSTEKLFYLCAELARRAAFGVVDIFVGDPVPQDNRFLDDEDKVVARRYLINIGARKVFWQYAIYPHYRSSLAAADVTLAHGNGGGITFRSPQLRGDGAVVVRSQSKVALTDKPKAGINLTVPRPVGAGDLEFANLKNPSPADTRPVATGSDEYYSEARIYV